MMVLGFCHVLQGQGSSGFDFLSLRAGSPSRDWWAGAQLGGMTEGQSYVCFGGEAFPIGCPDVFRPP